MPGLILKKNLIFRISKLNPGYISFFCLVTFFDISCLGQLSSNINWEDTIGAKHEEEFSAMVNLPNGDFLLGGNSNSTASGDKSESGEPGGYDDKDYWIIKIDSLGNKIWDNTYEANDDDILMDIVSCNDGGFLIGGYSNSMAEGDKSDNHIYFGQFDYWIIRIDSNGNKLWDKEYGGNYQDELQKIVALDDGGFLLGGFSNSLSGFDKSENSMGYDGVWGSYDYWICLIDSTGNLISENTIGGAGGDYFQSAITSEDGDFILLGQSDSEAGYDKSEDHRGVPLGGPEDYWVVKVNSECEVVWDKTIGGTAYEEPHDLLSLNDSVFLITGSSKSSTGFEKSADNKGGSDYWFVAMTWDKIILWDKTIGGNSDDIPFDAIKIDNGLIVAGGTSKSHAGEDKSEDNHDWPSYDYWIVCIDSTGQKLWDKTYGCNSYDDLRELLITNDNDIVIGGYSDSDTCSDKSEMTIGTDNDPDFWIINITPGFTFQLQEEISSCFVDYYLLPWGDTALYSGTYIDTILNTYVDTIWKINLIQTLLTDSVLNYGNFIQAIETEADSYIWIDCNSGEIVGYGYQDFFPQYEGDFAVILQKDSCIDTSECVHIIPISIENFESQYYLYIHPNPATNIITIESENLMQQIELFNMSGISIFKVSDLVSANFTINISDLPSGIYIVKVCWGNSFEYAKFVKN